MQSTSLDPIRNRVSARPPTCDSDSRYAILLRWHIRLNDVGQKIEYDNSCNRDQERYHM